MISASTTYRLANWRLGNQQRVFSQELLAGASVWRSLVHLAQANQASSNTYLGPSVPGIALPIFGEPADVGTSVQAVAGLVVQTIAYQADLDDSEFMSALESAGSTRVVRRSSRTTDLSLGGAWMGASLRADIKRQAPKGIELPNTAQATPEIIDQLLTSIQAEGLMPVLVFDDTDRWFRSAGGAISHHDLALSFFGTVLPELRQRPAGLVVAAHTNYLDAADLAEHLRSTIEHQIRIPVLANKDAVGKVIRSRVIAHTTPEDPASAPSLAEVFQDAALDRLSELCLSEFDGAVRDVLRTVHVAVTEACNGGFETVTPELIDQAAVW